MTRENTEIDLPWWQNDELAELASGVQTLVEFLIGDRLQVLSVGLRLMGGWRSGLECQSRWRCGLACHSGRRGRSPYDQQGAGQHTTLPSPQGAGCQTAPRRSPEHQGVDQDGGGLTRDPQEGCQQVEVEKGALVLGQEAHGALGQEALLVLGQEALWALGQEAL